jgi:hypothetical protein
MNVMTAFHPFRTPGRDAHVALQWPITKAMAARSAASFSALWSTIGPTSNDGLEGLSIRSLA